MIKKMFPVHPGEVLSEEFLKPLGLTQYRVAKDISVPPRRLNEIVLGRRSVSVDTALRLGHYFKTSPEFWMNLQNHFDIERQYRFLGKRLEKEVVRAVFARAK